MPAELGGGVLESVHHEQRASSRLAQQVAEGAKPGPGGQLHGQLDIAAVVGAPVLAQALDQVDRGRVVGLGDCGESSDAVLPGPADERLEHRLAQSPTLPVVNHRDGNLGAGWAIPGPDVAGDRQLVAPFRVDGDDRLMVVVVDFSQVGDHGRAQLGGNSEETAIARLRAEAVERVHQALLVVGLDWPEQDVPSRSPTGFGQPLADDLRCRDISAPLKAVDRLRAKYTKHLLDFHVALVVNHAYVAHDQQSGPDQHGSGGVIGDDPGVSRPGVNASCSSRTDTWRLKRG